MTLLSSVNKESLILGMILPVSKPLGWTSFDVVGKLRVIIRHSLKIPKIKVGHAGTLDPLADGLLLICTGKMTKEIERLQDMPKTYTGIIRLGATTPSFDLETEIDEHFPYEHIKENDIHAAAAAFKGTIMQIPPVFSAIKINGKRAYDYARRNQEVEMKAREVNIYSFSIEKIDLPSVHFKVVCSKGTYIRSLARDFGAVLNSGGFLEKLSRTSIGDYELADALSLTEIEEWLKM
jgi:tRNA pseudouridine55 synthase